MAEQNTELTNLELEAGSEWRFELEGDENMAVRTLSQGSVLINSEEINPTTWYPIHRYTKAAIYAPSPARLQVANMPASQYTSSPTNQPQLINIHLALERERILAKRGQGSAPRVMVIGQANAGKTTVVKNLVNMALGSGLGWTPGVVGLDPASPPNLIPGSISLSTPSHTLPTHHIAHPLGAPSTSTAGNTLSGNVETLAWWLGTNEPTSKNLEVWKLLVRNLADAWEKRCQQDKNAAVSGLFVDTSSAFTVPSLSKKKDDHTPPYSLVTDAVQALDIDTILIIGNEKLQIGISRLPLLQARGTTVIRLPKSDGAVDLDDAYRSLAHSFIVRTYFYGEPPLPPQISSLVGKMVGLDSELTPYSFQIPWYRLSVMRVGEENTAPSSALPLGSSKVVSPTRLVKVDPSGPGHVVRLLNTVLALVQVKKEDWLNPEEMKEEKEEHDGEGAEGTEGEVKEEEQEDEDDEVPYKEEIGTREVLGFIVITAIDTVKKKYTVLSPSPGKLPSTVAIAGHIEWVDSA
ncbi:protein Clp1 [Cryptococcus wingfieldii CBS 7118]|uniref:Polynucleotide 5'-hydroxyl-kinase GRC3 n=1 Tax=Cryptococcus wingfieldii CBS 7118 TaxID=1295528 RepID=A0A1E3IVW9_9TREE|nr:protein Clp1 [Cryptococcus wingfieldii CBS 7118]ODN92739.1 protein Clp1 [Cryptococcus wingfieldii CBS 7118]